MMCNTSLLYCIYAHTIYSLQIRFTPLRIMSVLKELATIFKNLCLLDQSLGTSNSTMYILCLVLDPDLSLIFVVNSKVYF